MNLKHILLCAAALACALPAAAQNNIWDKTALSAAPASDDELLIFDTSAGASKNIAISYLFTSPTLVTPTLGVATATSLNGLTITASTGTLTIPNSASLITAGAYAVTLTATNTTGITLPTTGTLATLAGAESLTNKTITAPVLSGTATGTYTLAGTGTITAPAISAPVLSGTATGTYTLAGTPTLTAAVLSGTFTGTYTLAGTGTITAPAISAPVLSGTATGTYTLAGTGTLTSPVINTPTVKDLTEVVAATNVIAATETGSVFYLNHATEFVSTLPAPAAGLHFNFVITGAPSGASYTVVTTSSANIIKGNQNSVAGDAGDSGTADDTITFADGQAVAGDRIECFSDGTYWYVYGTSRVAAGITFS